MTLVTNYTNTTPSTDNHPGAHNATNTAVNDHETRIVALETGGGSTDALAWKEPVRLASSGPFASLAGLLTVDGITTGIGNRVLVKNQASGIQNGIYTVNTGAWTRTSDANAAGDIEGMVVFVQEGTTLADTAWACTTNGTITPGTTVLTYAQFGGGGGAPTGTAGGDLTGTYPNPTVVDDSHAHTGTTISALAATDITSGTVATARLGGGTASATTFLRGDQTWATPAGGGGSESEVTVAASAPTVTGGLPELWVDTAAAAPDPQLSTTFLMSDFGLSAANTGTNAALNSTAIRDAIAACFAAGGGDVLFDIPGTYEVACALHPNGSGGFSQVVAAIRANVYLRGCGRDLVTLKLAANPNSGMSSAGNGQSRFFMNWNPSASGTVDENFGVIDLTLDGNCANAGSGTGSGVAGSFTIMHGIQWWYARNTLVRNCIIKNMRGNNASTEEVFHCDALRCQDVRVIDTVCLGDDGGNTSSGFSMNWVDRFWVDRCASIGMKTGQGYTWFSSANGMTSNCYAGDINRYGFNMEHSWDLAYVNCHSGSESPWSTSDNPPVVYTQGDTHPCARAYMLNFTDGGGRISYVNCTARGGTEANIGLIGSLTTTATTGTTGTTLTTATASFFSAAWIGRYVKVGAGNWVRISGYTNGTTVTTTPAHGGTSGNTVLIQSGDISWTGSISGGDKGIQFYDGTDELKQLTIRRSDFTGARFDANTTCDMEDVGNAVGRQVIATGAATTARTSGMVAGTEFYNPFPMDMRVCTTTASGATDIRGRNPGDTLTPTGQTGQSTYHVPAGGAIRVATSVVGVTWWYPK